MNYKVIHDMPGRIRLRCGQDAFTLDDSYNIEYTLENNNFIENVTASYITGSILIYYNEGFKESVLDLVSNLSLNNLMILPEALNDKSKELNEEFTNKLVYKFVKRGLVKTLIPFPIRKALILFSSAKYIFKAAKSLVSLNVNVDLLDGTAIGMSLAQGSYSTASSIMFLLSLSDMLEDYTRQKAKNALTNSLAINIENVWKVCDDSTSLVPLSSIQIDDVVRVQTGNMIPVDGTIINGEASINESSMTGEGIPAFKSVEDSVYAGTVVEEGIIDIKVRALHNETRINKIIELIDQSEELKADVQNKAEKLADSIVPFSFIGAGLIFLFTRNLRKATSVLLVDYSCAIKLSTPISVISAMKEASTKKIMVKGGKYLEEVANADTIVFDKTGTLTVATPKLKKVIPCNGYKRDEVLRISACLEEHFPHSVANAIVQGAIDENLVHKEEHAEVNYVVAHGISSNLNGEKVLIGSYHFIVEDEHVIVTEEELELINKEADGCSIIYLAIAGKLAGFLCIEDPIREEAKYVIEALKEEGIKNVVMLTGDGESTASIVAKKLGITEYKSQVLPDNKASVIEALKEKGHKVIMVGDGINDSPALASANVSISMKDSSDLAREVSDISLLSSNLEDLVILRKLSTALMNKINKNFRFIITFNTSLLLLSLFGVITPTTSALLHNLSTMGLSAKSMNNCLK